MTWLTRLEDLFIYLFSLHFFLIATESQRNSAHAFPTLPSQHVQNSVVILIITYQKHRNVFKQVSTSHVISFSESLLLNHIDQGTKLSCHGAASQIRCCLFSTPKYNSKSFRSTIKKSQRRNFPIWDTICIGWWLGHNEIPHTPQPHCYRDVYEISPWFGTWI